ncbi:MobA/MobL family protein [Croceicoccus hydrothermalis]|uniref:MobA/MobL family protein n=1 Tax=Croceicoccus hydrothermalis TaxID=2867964 RepID=UPI001EFADC56|nr:MobA/MobL family protein [Croceicoccus hydrothermalis]
MEEQGRDTESGPRWQHQWQAIAAKRRIDELQAIGALHKGFRRRNDAEGYIPALSRKSGGKRAAETTIDFAVPSSLTSRDRQGGGRRIPHFDITNISARGAPTKNGQPPRGCAIADSKISGHVDYLHDGAKVTFQSHIDYIRRQTDRERPWETCDIDMVDEPHMRARLNELSIYSNIEGGIERQRSLFEAAGRIEPKPKTFELLSSTADLAELSELAQDLDTSHFIHEMLDKLERTKAEAERRAARKGKPPKAFEAVIASGSSEQVYDWLTGLDETPEIRAKVDWKAGRAGRIQIRFVAEFPLGLTDIERFRIMKLFCDSLAADGMMVVGAIHSPDQTNDKRNYHLHVDAYDRPAVWLANHRCWDFEYAERKNGKTVYPIRQKKVRYAEPPAKIWRQRFIDQVELIRAGRPEITQFVHGTYNENGIELTPLEHMGSRAISLEGRGIVTDIGSRNAERIWNDEKSAAERRVKQKLKREIGQIEAFRPFIKHDADAVAASKRYLELCHEKTARELQEELIDIEIRVARSRAETVIQTLTRRIHWTGPKGLAGVA